MTRPEANPEAAARTVESHAAEPADARWRPTLVQVEHASRWYGNVVAVNDVTMTIGPGVTGLLGPNGAGKTTMIQLMAGFLAPSAGVVAMDGQPVWRNEAAYRQLGLVPETEGLYDSMTAWDFVLANAKLHGLADARAAAGRALEVVEMQDSQSRKLGTFSKGMKQRIRMATALVHDPAVLLLDEPFNGMDPRQRLHLMALLRRLADQGRTLLFSSHILEEVEQVASHIEVIVAGRHAASGDFREIRRLMTDRPHRYVVRSSDNRVMAAALIADGSSMAVELDERDGVLRVQTVNTGRFSWLAPQVARQAGIRLFELIPTDESLESVFSYLVTRSAS
jgi:ABC-2 type transport system ATP-binding protein